MKHLTKTMRSCHSMLKASRLRSQIESGFTLLEMLVVMVIIGLLAGLIGPRIFGKVDSSKVQTAYAQIKMIEGGLQIMRLDIGQLPAGETALQWLVQTPNDPAVAATWKGPYMEGQLPMDPWNNPYQIVSPGPNGKIFAVISYGADGKAGGEGLNADIQVK